MTFLAKLRSLFQGCSSEAVTGVTVLLNASHRSRAGNVHPHQWEVTAFWPEQQDAMISRYRLTDLLSNFEGKCLPDKWSRGEQLAQVICEDLKCTRVEVRRHAEGIIAIYPGLSR
jgi:hypothetical protein